MALSHANVLLLLWHGRQEPEICSRLYDIAVELAHSSGTGKMAAVSIVQPGASAPSLAARQALARLHEDRLAVVHRSALVFKMMGSSRQLFAALC